MISVSVWLPLRMPRSVETSKMTAWVGIFSLMALSRTWSFLSPGARRNARPGLARDGAVRDREAEHLGEARLAGAEEARDPDRDALVRLVRGLAIRVEDAGVVRADRVRDDVLVDFVANDLFVGLVDLDDFFDATVDVVGEERLDGRGHRHRRWSSEDLGR
jgi:hypothetical protein